MSLENLPPFLRIAQVQELTQLSRAQVYALARRWRETGGKDGMPVVEFGRNLRVPTAALMRMALIDPDDAEGEDSAA